MRNSRIELLRIFSMIMIVLSHYTVHNGINNWELPLGFNRFLLEIIKLGNIGVIIFVMITGYFGIQNKKTLNIKKIFLLIFETLFYSIIFYLLFIILGKANFSIDSILHNFFPITFKSYWFMTVFIVLYFLIPYINIFLKSMTRNTYLSFLFTCILFFFVLQILTGQNYYSSEIIYFILFYSIGAYLYLYKDNFFSKKNNSKLCMMLSISILILSVVIIDLIGKNNYSIVKHSTHLFNLFSPVCLLLAISIFSLFINNNIFNNKIINKISSCVLGVYLISENILIRSVLWKDILKVYKFVNSPLLILHMIGSIILIFIICILIDLIRKHTIEILIIKIYNKTLKKLDNKINILLN